jgi:enoyl-[acyl-carrier protein] reductase I
MGLLDGKRALIFGVANDHSIAWGIARALHAHGAVVGFSSIESLIERRVRPLAEQLGSTFVEPCDVRSDEEIRSVLDLWGQRHGELDILVHALAFAKRDDLAGQFVDTSRDGFALALDVSAYSLVALAREARPLLRSGGSIMTLTYYGAEKVTANYNVMGVAKAALEASVRYLARTGSGSTPSAPAPCAPWPRPVWPGSSGCTAPSPTSPRCARTSRSTTSAARPSGWRPTSRGR